MRTLPFVALYTFMTAGCMMDIDTGARRHEADGAPTGTPPAASSSGSTSSGGPRPVDRWKELMVIDASVRLSPMGRGTGAQLSFATVVTELAGSPVAAETWVRGWLETMSATTHLTTPDGTELQAAPRPAVESQLLCPWLKLRSQNACDAGCGYCRERVLDLAQAPFALLAVVNRPDLGDPCDESSAEGRLVFTALRPGTSTTLPFTVIFEYLQPGTGREVAARWHALGSLPFGRDYGDALGALTDAFVRRRGAKPPPLLRLRTNEGAFGNDGSWELRELAVGPSGFVPAPVAATPAQTWDGSPALAELLRGASSPVVPDFMSTLASPIPSSTFRWRADVPETTRRTFSAGTCNGCHGGERPVDALRFQHVAPAGSYYGSLTEPPRVSRYLDDPSRNGDDELGRRAGKLEEAWKATCSPAPGGPGTYPAPRMDHARATH